MSYLRYSIRPTFPTDTLREDPIPNLQEPSSMVRYWNEHIGSDPTIDSYKENLLVIAITKRFDVLGHHLVSVGTQDECLVNISEVLRPVILSGTSRFILVHNHPSGNPAPSPADLRITKKLRHACDFMDMRVVDHVIIGSKGINSYYSFLENGELY